MYNLTQKLLDWESQGIMLVRIRFRKGCWLDRRGGEDRRVALAFAALLTPAAALAGVFALWRLAADLKWTSQFVIPSGLFSHWQVWIALAALLHLGATVLSRYGRGAEVLLPRVLMFRLGHVPSAEPAPSKRQAS